MNQTIQKSIPKHPFRLMRDVYRYILPEVRSELVDWRHVAEKIPTTEYRKQALASMTSKQFHCEGGAIYTSLNLARKDVLIPLIVAFQTISDYLDNLCDRSDSLNEDDFRQLHLSMIDAIDPEAPLRNYYKYRTQVDDGDYLASLVSTCQQCISALPGYTIVKPTVDKLVSLYCDLQVYKHVDPTLREEKLLAWWALHKHAYPKLYWNEFAAATGSTLAVFTLFAAATNEKVTLQEVEAIEEAYFPSICGLHILLDYFIDQEEDRVGGDLNFCSYYENDEVLMERMFLFANEAKLAATKLHNRKFHLMIVEGLIALYLSDPKVKTQRKVRRMVRKLMKNSPLIRLYFWVNSVWIRKAL